MSEETTNFIWSALAIGISFAMGFSTAGGLQVNVVNNVPPSNAATFSCDTSTPGTTTPDKLRGVPDFSRVIEK